MRKPKKILNNPNNVRQEVMEALAYVYQGKLATIPEACSVYRNNIHVKQVVVVSGGGSGHEPTFSGFVGEGCIDACALGEVFTSPSPDQIIAATKAVNKDNGVLFLYGNYAGDGMNFDIAAELLAEEGIEIRTIRAADDIASAPIERMIDRRGVGGIMYAYKIAGAAAQHKGYNLDRVCELTERACFNTRTIGVALDGCALPQSTAFNFELPEDEIEIGIGIHGEAGLRRQKLTTTDELVAELVDKLCADLPFEKGDEICVSINNLGALSYAEQLIISRKVGIELEQRNIKTYDIEVGHFCTSLEMSGFSISFFKLDPELKELYNLPCKTLAWRK